METTILANGKPVGKFGSGSMKGIDQTALEGIGSVVGPKGGGKSPTHDVLVKWIERVIELAKKNLEAAKANAGGTLSASIVPEDIELSAKQIVVAIMANPYWKFVDQGVHGRSSSYISARDSKFRYENKIPPPQAIADWIANKEIAVIPTYSRKLKRMRTKQEQGLVLGRTMAFAIRERGVRGTKFMSNAVSPEMIEVLTENIAEVLGKSISVATTR
jgi:hypothetical protein